jgi:glycosyltransferase involved in cell wall biosynthesis
MNANSTPLVSIVTPSYNQSRFLERTIRSVLGQNYSNLEYIVMDGGSDDGSSEIIRRYADRITYWESQKDKGQTDAINKGFSHASGDIFAWINSDDIYEPGAIQKAVNYLQNHPDVGMVYGDCNFIDAEDQVIGRFNAKQTNYERLKTGFVHIPQQSAFWRAELWRQVAPLDDSIYFAMDYDLWLRLSKISKIVYYPETWASFRLHGDAKTVAEDDRGWIDMVKIHYRNGGKFFSTIIAKYYIRKLAAPIIKARRRKMMNLTRLAK